MWKDFFYIPEVLGKNGEPFRFYKIRTMQRDADDSLDRVLTEQGLDSCGKVCDDPRITSRGKFLRRYWIDELPQLLNLARGDLRLVGIRPKSERMWVEYPEEHKERALHYKPGWMGIHYAFMECKNFQDVVKVEQRYMDEKEQYPLWTDVKYFFLVLYNVLFCGLRSH